MKRRIALFGIILGIPAMAMPPEDAVFEVANSFADKYNRWANHRNAPKPGTIDAQELLAWREARECWKKLDKLVRY